MDRTTFHPVFDTERCKSSEHRISKLTSYSYLGVWAFSVVPRTIVFIKTMLEHCICFYFKNLIFGKWCTMCTKIILLTTLTLYHVMLTNILENYNNNNHNRLCHNFLKNRVSPQRDWLIYIWKIPHLFLIFFFSTICHHYITFVFYWKLMIALLKIYIVLNRVINIAIRKILFFGLVSRAIISADKRNQTNHKSLIATVINQLSHIIAYWWDKHFILKYYNYIYLLKPRFI